ncbi:MAG: hypothetical protein A2V70_00380 [Planctomycetes bacterium RBG_13_63_9]|nr:MAG: hypothetical protein A2V70_00380 [Planctomycetes bacterium RBG_13_63_9]
MAHIYAGILGPLAFLISLARGAMHGGGAESVLWSAWCSLLVFAAVGYLVGWIAGRIVEDSVRARISSRLTIDRRSEHGRPASSGAVDA